MVHALRQASLGRHAKHGACRCLLGSAPLGSIIIYRPEPGPFPDKHISLLQTFADQAVIAIENVRLFTELQEKNQALTTAHAQVTETLDQQTATGEILRVISSSPTDVQPVFDAIVASASRLCEATLSFVSLLADGQMTVGSVKGVDPAGVAALRRTFPRTAARDTAVGRAMLDRQLVHLADAKADAGYTYPGREALGIRSILAVPMLREGITVGAITVWRPEVRPFTDKQTRRTRRRSLQLPGVQPRSPGIVNFACSSCVTSVALWSRVSATSGGRTVAHSGSPLQWATAALRAGIMENFAKMPRISSSRACWASASGACQVS
jgi:GAF domain